MRAGFLKKEGAAALLMLAAALGGAGTARAQQAEKLQFSEVPEQGPVLVSNINKLNPNPSNFKQVKEDLLRPFNSLDPRNSLNVNDFMDNALPPPPRPGSPMFSRRMQEIQDQKRNWAFTLYEELNSPQDEMEKKMFGIKEYGEDGRQKQEISVMDRYYQSLGQKSISATNQDALNARAEFINKNGFDPLGKTFNGDPFMKKMFGVELPDSAADKIEGLPGAAANDGPAIGSPEEVLLQQKRLGDLRRSIMGDSGPARPGQLGQPLTTDDYYTRGTKIAAQNLLDQQMSEAAALKEKRANPFLAADPLANALHSHINDDLTAKALGLPQPVKATNAVTRPAPTAQSVTAEWDPFGANRPKPRF